MKKLTVKPSSGPIPVVILGAKRLVTWSRKDIRDMQVSNGNRK